jgi:hypothetical protein
MPFAVDIVVAGGSLSAPAAALQAARDNPDATILLIECTDWLGGQATSQGVAAIDNAWHQPGAGLMRTHPDRYYPVDYLEWIRRIKGAPKSAPGFGYGGDEVNWVSREGFDPRTAAWVLDQMVAEQHNIVVLKMAVVKAVESVAEGDHRRITGLTLIERTPKEGYVPFSDFLSDEVTDWYSTAVSNRFRKVIHQVTASDPSRGLVVVDATEFGDVMVLSGADYTVGREIQSEKFDATGNAPAIDELGSQAFVFPFCMSTAQEADSESAVRAWWPDFEQYFAEQARSFYSRSNTSFARIWTYRRLRTIGAPAQYDSVFPGDVTMQNWNPGNDYPYGTLFVDKASATKQAADWKGGIDTDQLAGAEKHAVGWYFFMKRDKSTEFDTRYPHGEMEENMMATAHGLSKMPYLRCTRRLVGPGNFRIQSREFTDTNAPDYAGGPSFRYFDSVGIGNYASDVHATKISRGLSPKIEKPAPFYIPYRSIASKNVVNLLAAGKNIAVTYLTNSAYRLHPIEWASGSAAGAAAAILCAEKLPAEALLESTRLRQLQRAVVANSPIHWAAFDAAPIPPQLADLIANDRRAIAAGAEFPVEVSAVRDAERVILLVDGVRVGERNSMINGAFQFVVPGLERGGHSLAAELYAADGKLLGVVEESIHADRAETDAVVVDNAEAHCHFVGNWTRGTAQPNRYATDYDFASGGINLASATWHLPLSEGGEYEISLWYPEAYNRATDSPFTVHHAEGKTTVRVDQTKNGGRWIPIGRFRFDPPQAKAMIVLSNEISDSTRLVVADAVRAQKV